MATITGSRGYYSSLGLKKDFRCENASQCNGWVYSDPSTCGVSGWMTCAQSSPLSKCKTLGTAMPYDLNTGLPSSDVFPSFGNCTGSLGPCTGVCTYSQQALAVSSQNILAYTDEYCNGTLTCPDQSDFDAVMRMYCTGVNMSDNLCVNWNKNRPPVSQPGPSPGPLPGSAPGSTPLPPPVPLKNVCWQQNWIYLLISVIILVLILVLLVLVIMGMVSVSKIGKDVKAESTLFAPVASK